MRWRLHVNLWHAAAESLRRHPADAAAAFVPLLVAVAVCAAFNFVRDGMLADALLATGTLPDLTVQAMLGGRPDRLSAIRAEHIAHLDGVERTAARVWGYLPINTGGLALTYTLVGLDVDRMPRPDAIGLAMAGGRFL
ncbi:MAG: hypothetical protein WCL16_04680, partial [bacterium]